MKNTLYTLLCVIAILITPFFGEAQQKPTWGGDINVLPAAGRFYKNVRVTVGYDGTIYVGRLYALTAQGPYQNWEVLKSSDNGVTFSLYIGSAVGTTNRYTAFDIIAAGEDATDFRLYIARPFIDTVSFEVTMRVDSYDKSGTPSPVTFDNEVYTSYTAKRGFDYICWATDSRMPATESSPYTVSLVASKATNDDSLIAWTSNNGGSSFIRRELEGSATYIKSVSASLGVNDMVSDYPRLGIAYEKQNSIADTTGQIWVRFVYGDDLTDVAYTGPYRVGVAGKAYSQPTIAMSQTRTTATGNGFDDYRTIVSYSNVESDMNVSFQITDNLYLTAPDFASTGVIIGSGTGNQMLPHMVFDPLFSNFILTYYDQKTGMLPYLIKGLGTAGAQAFSPFYPNYRDVTSASSPNIQPRVDMNISTSTAVFAWNDKYKCMFDAENSTVDIFSPQTNVNELIVYPNPVRDNATLSFESKNACQVNIQITDMSGRLIRSSAHQVLQGKNEITLNLKDISSGQYLIQLNSADINGRTIITINK